MQLKIKTLLVVCATLMFNQSKAQNFEGSITYVLDVELSEEITRVGVTKSVILEKMKSEGLFWDTITTSHKQGNMYSFLGNSGNWSIYRTDSNKIFTFQNIDSADICEAVDASMDMEQSILGKAPKVFLLDTVAMVNGIPCKIVRVKWKSGAYDYYFNGETAKVDPTLYSKHNYDGWAEYMKLAGSLPLKIVKSNKAISISMTMVKMTTMTISDGIFTIPSLTYDKDLNAVQLPNKKYYKFKR